jgi:hypothetical protein
MTSEFDPAPYQPQTTSTAVPDDLCVVDVGKAFAQSGNVEVSDVADEPTTVGQPEVIPEGTPLPRNGVSQLGKDAHLYESVGIVEEVVPSPRGATTLSLNNSGIEDQLAEAVHLKGARHKNLGDTAAKTSNLQSHECLEGFGTATPSSELESAFASRGSHPSRNLQVLKNLVDLMGMSGGIQAYVREYLANNPGASLSSQDIREDLTGLYPQEAAVFTDAWINGVLYGQSEQDLDLSAAPPAAPQQTPSAPTPPPEDVVPYRNMGRGTTEYQSLDIKYDLQPSLEMALLDRDHDHIILEVDLGSGEVIHVGQLHLSRKEQEGAAPTTQLSVHVVVRRATFGVSPLAARLVICGQRSPMDLLPAHTQAYYVGNQQLPKAFLLV